MPLRQALLLTFGLLVAACGGGGAQSDDAGDGTQTVPTVGGVPTASLDVSCDPDGSLAAVLAACADLATRLEGDITVVSVEPARWPDSCLGFAQVDEVCSQIVTSGYEIVLRVGLNRLTYRTDTTGNNLRIAGISVGSD